MGHATNPEFYSGLAAGWFLGVLTVIGVIWYWINGSGKGGAP